MRVLITGVGDAFTKKHFGSSALIEALQGYVQLDCPDLIHRALHEATGRAGWNVDADDIHDILLTHLHGDHCNGLESFGFLRRFHRADNPNLPLPRLHTSPAAAERVWERLAPAMDGAASEGPNNQLKDFYDLRIMTPDAPDSPDRAAQIAGLSVRCRYTGHPVPTIGLLITDGRATLGWSSDTPFEQAHIDWLSEADVIVHESNTGAAHTDIEQLNALSDDLRRKMRIVHQRDDFDPSRTDITLLNEGDVLRIEK